MLYSIKKLLRICDCLLTHKQRTISFRGDPYKFFSTYWWDNTSQDIFDQEIAPYFEALGDFQPSVILDVGAATGHFSVLASKIFPGCAVYAFEPSQRQRILLSRNARLNHVAGLKIEPFGLWSRSDMLPFRTIGAESSFAAASQYQGTLEFPEDIRVVALDEWTAERHIERIDVIKIDAEGAELEILEGARATLVQFRPRLLVQAYHTRNGVRTFERCAEILTKTGYHVRECLSQSGLLVGVS
jgi:FkbM family methyltransferase